MIVTKLCARDSHRSLFWEFLFLHCMFVPRAVFYEVKLCFLCSESFCLFRVFFWKNRAIMYYCCVCQSLHTAKPICTHVACKQGPEQWIEHHAWTKHLDILCTNTLLYVILKTQKCKSGNHERVFITLIYLYLSLSLYIYIYMYICIYIYIYIHTYFFDRFQQIAGGSRRAADGVGSTHMYMFMYLYSYIYIYMFI